MSSIEVDPDWLLDAAGRIGRALDEELNQVRHGLYLVAVAGTEVATGGDPAAVDFERLRVELDQAAVRLKSLVGLFDSYLRQAGGAYSSTDEALGSLGAGPP